MKALSLQHFLEHHYEMHESSLFTTLHEVSPENSTPLLHAQEHALSSQKVSPAKRMPLEHHV